MMMFTGMILAILGAMMGDSENLTIPLLFIATGAALVFISHRRDIDETSDETSETGH